MLAPHPAPVKHVGRGSFPNPSHYCRMRTAMTAPMSAHDRIVAAFSFQPPGRVPTFDSFWVYPDAWRERFGPFGAAGIGAGAVEDPQVVDPRNVIEMRVGQEHVIDPCQAFPQRLLTEVPAAVQEDVPAAAGDQQRSVGALVARVGGQAGRARAADHRHPVAGPRAQKGHDHGSAQLSATGR